MEGNEKLWTSNEKAMEIMNRHKITSLCVHNKSNQKKTVGVLHIHNLISANIT